MGVVFKVFFCLVLFLLTGGSTIAQLPGPGAERDMRRINEMKQGNALQKDTVTIVDTVVVFDPETYVETMTVVTSKFSIYEYCQQVLGISKPEELLDGREMTITCLLYTSDAADD